jgi:hypothetical protein
LRATLRLVEIFRVTSRRADPASLSLASPGEPFVSFESFERRVSSWVRYAISASVRGVLAKALLKRR